MHHALILQARSAPPRGRKRGRRRAAAYVQGAKTDVSCTDLAPSGPSHHNVGPPKALIAQDAPNAPRRCGRIPCHAPPSLPDHRVSCSLLPDPSTSTPLQRRGGLGSIADQPPLRKAARSRLTTTRLTRVQHSVHGLHELVYVRRKLRSSVYVRRRMACWRQRSVVVAWDPRRGGARP
jgi:hypothetical protein